MDKYQYGIVEEGAVGDYVKGKVDDLLDQSIGEVGRNIDRKIERGISSASATVVTHKPFTTVARLILKGLTSNESPFLGARSPKMKLAETMVSTIDYSKALEKEKELDGDKNSSNHGTYTSFKQPSVVKKSIKKIANIVGKGSVSYMIATVSIDAFDNENVVNYKAWGDQARKNMDKIKKLSAAQLKERIAKHDGLLLNPLIIKQLHTKFFSTIELDSKHGKMLYKVLNSMGFTYKLEKDSDSLSEEDLKIKNLYIKKMLYAYMVALFEKGVISYVKWNGELPNLIRSAVKKGGKTTATSEGQAAIDAEEDEEKETSKKGK